MIQKTDGSRWVCGENVGTEEKIVHGAEGDYSIILDKNPNNESKGYMGIQAAKHYELDDGVASIYGDTLPWI